MVRERRGHLTLADGTRLLQILDALEVEVVGETVHRSLESLAHFAWPHKLTAYDALYLELAIRLSTPLCTFDRELQSAAADVGVPLAVQGGGSSAR